jgi:hypothetical protein
MSRLLDIGTCIIEAAEAVGLDISPDTEVFEKLVEYAKKRDLDSLKEYLRNVTQGQIDVEMFTRVLSECLEEVSSLRKSRSRLSETVYNTLLVLVSETDDVMLELTGLKSVPSYDESVLVKLLRRVLRGSPPRRWRVLSRLMEKLLQRYARYTLRLDVVFNVEKPVVKVSSRGLVVYIGDHKVLEVSKDCTVRLSL